MRVGWGEGDVILRVGLFCNLWNICPNDTVPMDEQLKLAGNLLLYPPMCFTFAFSSRPWVEILHRPTDFDFPFIPFSFHSPAFVDGRIASNVRSSAYLLSSHVFLSECGGRDNSTGRLRHQKHSIRWRCRVSQSRPRLIPSLSQSQSIGN